MKKYKRIVLLTTLAAIMLMSSGCGTKNVQKGNETNSQVTNTNQKPEQDSKSSESEDRWKIVFQEDLKVDFLKSGFLNEKIGIATGFTGENYFTSDGGKNWTLSKNESNNTNGFDIIKDSIAWYGDDFGDIGVSTDMGKKWSFGKGVFLQRVNCISAIDPSTALIASKDKASLTEDGGKTMTDIKLPEKIDQIAAACLYTKNEGFLLDVNGKIYHSADRFATWNTDEIKDDKGAIQIRFDPGASSSTAYIRCIDAENIIAAYCGIDSGVFVMRSTDGGKSWVKETVTNDFAHNVYISQDGNYITYNSEISKVNVLKVQ